MQQFPYADVSIKKDDTDFVIHGSDENAVNQKFDKIMEDHPEISRERLEVDRQQVKTYITGCKDAEDNAFNLPEDKEYAACSTSIYVALHLGCEKRIHHWT